MVLEAAGFSTVADKIEWDFQSLCALGEAPLPIEQPQP
jgi:hypothetical protein